MEKVEKAVPEKKGPINGRGLGNVKKEEIKRPVPPRGMGRGLGRPRVQNRGGNR